MAREIAVADHRFCSSAGRQCGFFPRCLRRFGAATSTVL
jgi:hypothetical protein